MKSKTKSLKIGQKVLIEGVLKGTIIKLDAIYDGPFRVTWLDDGGIVIALDFDSEGKHRVPPMPKTPIIKVLTVDGTIHTLIDFRKITVL